jgi:hypothetical protein
MFILVLMLRVTATATMRRRMDMSLMSIKAGMGTSERIRNTIQIYFLTRLIGLVLYSY